MSLLKSLTSFTVSSSSSNQKYLTANGPNTFFDSSSTQSKLNYYNNVHFIGVRFNN